MFVHLIKAENILIARLVAGSYSEGILNFPDTNVIALDRDKTVINIAETFKKI